MIKILPLIFILFFFAISFPKGKPSLDLEAMENLDKNGMTLLDGIIMTKEDAMAIKKERFKPKKQLMDYGDEILAMEVSFEPKKIAEQRRYIIEKMDKDKELLPEARANILKILDMKEKTSVYYDQALAK